MVYMNKVKGTLEESYEIEAKELMKNINLRRCTMLTVPGPSVGISGRNQKPTDGQNLRSFSSTKTHILSSKSSLLTHWTSRPLLYVVRHNADGITFPKLVKVAPSRTLFHIFLAACTFLISFRKIDSA